MTKRISILTCICSALLLLLLPCRNCSAQEMKIVSGRIVNKTTNMPFGKDFAVYIFSFNTVAEGQDALQAMQNGEVIVANYEVADNNGYYQIRVPETGALIFRAEMADPILEKVNFRMEINIALEGGNILETVVVSSELKSIVPLPENPEIEGNMLMAKAVIPVPRFNGKTNARMIIQPFLFDGETGDTLRNLEPWVVDGEEYAITQERRMGFEGYRDPLVAYVKDFRLSADKMNIEWNDTIFLENPNKSYFVRGVVRLEDYLKVYFNKDYELASARVRRPLKFLEYSIDTRDLDPAQYRERARKERRNTTDRISLSFKINEARLDERDTMNNFYLNKLKQDLLDIVHSEDSQLKEFHIVGVSSPDGPYRKNLDLAKRRMNFALSQITSVLPKRVRDRVYMTTKAEVASWTDVVDLLQADSLVSQAEELRGIIEQYPGNIDRQGAEIRRLPYYRSIIVGYLPKLRSIQYSYIQEIHRELTPEEIMNRYRTDEEYISGRKHFELYEYWHLFQMIKDQDELDALYKRAYEESKEVDGKGWVLAANGLAVSYIRKGIVDTSILAPFIDTRIHRTDLKMNHMNGITSEIVNPQAVVANQLCMFLAANNYKRASVMAQLLPSSEQNDTLKAFTMCLGGYYKGGKTPEERAEVKQTFDIVKNSSPLNKVVMYLALNSAGGNQMADEALNALPPDDGLTYYLRAVIYSKKYEVNPMDINSLMTATDYLKMAFYKDRKFLGIAAGDADIHKDVYQDAELAFKAETEGMDASNYEVQE